ncbi:MAG TPA: SLBB domain-containing protein [Gemmatimonadales bacterium]|nr:SLBB domain-containing protein [Gemmatimonadales bacterium]
MTYATSTLRFGWSAISLLTLLGRVAVAQAPAGPNLATRAELQDTLARIQGTRGSDVRVKLMRARLEHGDFQVGDKVYIRIVGEQQVTDTFAVAPGPELLLPQMGVVPLAGVLRSELPALIEASLARYYRDPIVQVRPLIRLMVEGDVARPGYYALSPESPLADAITTAGGLTQGANVGDIRVERGTSAIWGGHPLQDALGRGSSLDQLHLQAGDRLIVPGKSGVTPLQLLVVFTSVVTTIYTVKHW